MSKVEHEMRDKSPPHQTDAYKKKFPVFPTPFVVDYCIALQTNRTLSFYAGSLLYEVCPNTSTPRLVTSNNNPPVRPGAKVVYVQVVCACQGLFQPNIALIPHGMRAPWCILSRPRSMASSNYVECTACGTSSVDARATSCNSNMYVGAYSIQHMASAGSVRSSLGKQECFLSQQVICTDFQESIAPFVRLSLCNRIYGQLKGNSNSP